MSEDIPSATADPHAVDHPLPANAEDRKAAAALNSLNTDGLAGDAAPSKGPSSADQEALSQAMSRLEVAAGHDYGKKTATGTQKKDAEVKKKLVKINAADVTLLVRGDDP
jgi:DNA uptake protein ComE-like DNA-binding protein